MPDSTEDRGLEPYAPPEPVAATPTDEGLSTAELAQTREPETRSFEGRGASETRTASQPAQTVAEPQATPLLAAGEGEALQTRWDDIQAGFVDEPRKAVQDADSLVAQTMKRLAEMFASERANLEGQWDRGDEVSTEDLRQALRRYRSFFARLLAV
jgi:hypothetical protein